MSTAAGTARHGTLVLEVGEPNARNGTSMNELKWITFVIGTTPDPALSPNSRVHWRKKHLAAKEQRAVAFSSVVNERKIFPSHDGRDIYVRYEVEWAGRRRRMDDDNLIAALKPMRDGVADALGGDDKLWITQRVTQTTGNDEPLTRIHLAIGD